MKKRKSFLAFTLMAALAVTGCNFNSGESSSQSPEPNNNGGTTTEQPSSGKKVLQVFNTDEIPSLDSAHVHETVSFTVLNNTMDGLYRRDQNGQPYLAIAEKHDVSADNLVHTFTIRENAKWSDGSPVTAKDFEFSWKKVFKEAGHYSFMFETLAVKNAVAIEKGEKQPDELGVKAVDDRTLEVTLEYPNPLLNQLLSFPTFYPQKQEFVESKGDKYGLEYDNMLYNGPFMLTDWKHDQGWTYTKNPNYWDAGKVKLDQIDGYVVKDAPARLTLFESGQLDRIELDSSYVDQFKGDPRFHIIETPTIYFIRFNHEHPVLKNKNIRKAISMAWDKKGLTDVILNDGSSPLNGLVPKRFATDASGKDFREFNGDMQQGTLEEAKKLWEQGLKESGVTEVKLGVNAADTDRSKKIGEYLKNQLEKNLPGLTLELKNVPSNQRLEIEKAITYDLSLGTWGPDYADPMTYIDMWVTGGSANRMKYSNPKYDELVQQAKLNTDLESRFKQMVELEKILIEEDVAIAPMYQEGLAILQKEYVKDFVYLPTAPTNNYLWVDIVK